MSLVRFWRDQGSPTKFGNARSALWLVHRRRDTRDLNEAEALLAELAA